MSYAYFGPNQIPPQIMPNPNYPFFQNNMIPNLNNQINDYNNLENRISTLENKVNELEKKISNSKNNTLEYQSSLHMM